MSGVIPLIPYRTAYSARSEELVIIEPEWSKEQIIAYAIGKTSQEGVPLRPVLDTIKCESDYVPTAVGDGGTSYGLSQIHIPAHPHITPEEALDPKFAIDFMVDEFKQGNEWKWTCYRLLYGS